MKKILNIIILLGISFFAYSQAKVVGTFSLLANQEVKLVGYLGFEKYTIDSVKANSRGYFELSYADENKGMAYLIAKNKKPFLIILDGKNIKLKGRNFELLEEVKILESNENKLFEQYVVEHFKREDALRAWEYLEHIYSDDLFFSKQKNIKQEIIKEKQRLQTEDSLFLSRLKSNSYAGYYLSVQKLVSSVPYVLKFEPQKIPHVVDEFRKFDYSDPRLLKSGLLANVIESHFFLIENSGGSMDSIYLEMNKSIDILIGNLSSDEQLLNEIGKHLFHFFEKRSLFRASEYLALELLSLNEDVCVINQNFAFQLESYRTMRVGAIVADFDFKTDVVLPKSKIGLKKLSDIKSAYTVLIFGASWCPQCSKELAAVVSLYPKWQKQNVEVVFVSLDQEEKSFKNFVSVFPFISICDYLGWESRTVQDYYVFATPTIFLLDAEREIVLRPSSVNQLDAWIEWYLVQKKQ